MDTYFIKIIGETLIEVLKWIAIIAGSILAPGVGIWAIIKTVKLIINKIINR